MLHIGFTAFNAEATLEDSLACLLSQDLEEWHMSIIDAGSSDRTLEIASDLAEKDSRITVIESPSRTSWFQNAKNHLGRSNSPFIMLADADDRWTPNWISENLKVLKRHELDASFGQLGVISHEGKVVPHIAAGNTIRGLDSRHRFLRQFRFALMPESRGKANLIYSVWRSEALHRLVPWHLESLGGSRDLQFLVKSLNSCRIGSTDQATIFRRQGPRQVSPSTVLFSPSAEWTRQLISLGFEVPGRLPAEYAQATEGLAARLLVRGVVEVRVALSSAIQFMARHRATQ